MTGIEIVMLILLYFIFGTGVSYFWITTTERNGFEIMATMFLWPIVLVILAIYGLVKCINYILKGE